jgi:hypothetical protein
MQRKSLLGKSIAAAGGPCCIQQETDSSASGSGPARMVSRPCSENRFEALNAVLDRDAVQRGWARSVDPDYHQTLQEVIGELQTASVGRF